MRVTLQTNFPLPIPQFNTLPPPLLGTHRLHWQFFWNNGWVKAMSKVLA